MKIWTKILISLSMYMLFSAVSTASFAAVLTLASSGNGVYALQGFGLSDVGGLDITISYDTSTLANPRVVQGALLSGGMMAVNGNSPGTIRMAGATSRSISGGGNLATVSFDLRGAGSGKVLSMSASLINSNGAKLPVQSLVQNPSDDSSTTNKNDSTQTNGTTTTQTTDTTQTVTTENTTSGGTIGPRYINAPGTVTLPAEKVDALKKKGGATESNELSPIDVREGGEDRPALEAGSEPQSKPARDVAATESRPTAYKSVLERFREFKGERTAKSLTALFDATAMPGIRQVPAVALSDGKSKVKLIVQLKSSGKFAPNFALKRAKLISLKIEGDAWVVEVLPDGKVCDVAVIVLNNGHTTEIPLTVAQDASGSKDLPGKLGENELSRILNVRGTGKARGYDLNGDGKQDYIDDYILTANYIAGQRKSNERTVQKVLNTKSL